MEPDSNKDEQITEVKVEMGVPENVNSHENAVEVAMMNKIMALLFPEARSIR